MDSIYIVYIVIAVCAAAVAIVTVILLRNRIKSGEVDVSAGEGKAIMKVTATDPKAGAGEATMPEKGVHGVTATGHSVVGVKGTEETQASDLTARRGSEIQIDIGSSPKSGDDD